MTWLALSLYGLGLVGAAAAVWRDEAPGLREWVIILCWPLAVAYAIAGWPLSKLWARR
jgi:hypothetical protein